MSGETSGIGPEDGFLAVNKKDRIKVVFTNDFETITKEADISWSVAIIEVQEDPNTGVDLIRITDYDMNFSNERIESIFLVNGLELVETGVQTGIFEKAFPTPY